MYHRSSSAVIAEDGDLETMLDFLSATPPVRLCPRCGSKMTQVDTTYFLHERAGESWYPSAHIANQDIENQPLI